jgi:hypothetical protein
MKWIEIFHVIVFNLITIITHGSMWKMQQPSMKA